MLSHLYLQMPFSIPTTLLPNLPGYLVLVIEAKGLPHTGLGALPTRQGHTM